MSPVPSLLVCTSLYEREHRSPDSRCPQYPPCFPLPCSPREPPSRCRPRTLRGPEARESRRGPSPGCRLLLAQWIASPGLHRWLDSARLLHAGRPPGLGLGGPPGAPPAELGPLRGPQARDGRVLLPEQTVHLGCSRCVVATPGAPQPICVPTSRLVSPHGVPLGMPYAHQESQGKRQKATPGVPQGASQTAGDSWRPHGAWRVGARDSAGFCSGRARLFADCSLDPPRASSRLGAPEAVECGPGSPPNEGCEA